MSDDVLSLPAGPELDAKVAEALGVAKRVRLPEMVLNLAFFENPTGEGRMYEPRGEADFLVPAGWDGESNVTVRAELEDGLRVAFDVRLYSTSGDEAVALAQRFEIRIFPVGADRATVSRYNGTAQTPVFVDGDSIPHAVARWVARYVKNGEVSDG